MNAIKKVFIGILIIIIVLCTVFYSYYAIENGAVVFAEDIHYMSDEELEAAYQAYLQSKSGGLIGNAGARLAYTNGKMLNFLTSDSNTTPFDNINEIKGLMQWQKTELESGNSSVLQLAMSPAGESVFSLYTQWLLQNHYFGNGVTENENGIFNDDIDNNLYSGEYFIDDDGNSCLVYVIGSTSSTSYAVPSEILAVGTTYRYNGSEAFSLSNNGNGYYYFDTNYKNVKYELEFKGTNNDRTDFAAKGTSGSTIYRTNYYNGELIIIKRNGNNYYIGTHQYSTRSSSSLNRYHWNVALNGVDSDSVDINFYTNKNNNILVFPTINEGDNLYITPKVNVGLNGEVDYQPYIINEGDTITNIVNNYYTDSGTKDKTITEPSDDPAVDGGGGGSSDNPSGGTPPDWSHNFPHLSPDGEGGFDFNFTLPDLNIDWNISGLSEKFPFSIPFDLVSFCRILDAEPVTPHFDGDIVLPMLTYHFDFDFERFDDLAQLVRNLEFIGFCIGLILITRSMIKG